jgi:RNA polymerase sigma-70 factor (ECF subfamily)
MVEQRDDVVVRVNRAVALAEVEGAEVGLRELEGLDSRGVSGYLPYHALRAHLLRRCGRVAEALAAYDAALALDPGDAERKWLERRRAEVGVAIESGGGELR